MLSLNHDQFWQVVPAFIQSAFLYLQLHLPYISRNEGSILAIRLSYGWSSNLHWVLPPTLFCTCTYMSHMHTHIRARTHTHTRTHAHTNRCSLSYTYIHSCMYMSMHTSTYTSLVYDMHTAVLSLLPIVFHDSIIASLMHFAETIHMSCAPWPCMHALLL